MKHRHMAWWWWGVLGAVVWTGSMLVGCAATPAPMASSGLTDPDAVREELNEESTASSQPSDATPSDMESALEVPQDVDPNGGQPLPQACLEPVTIGPCRARLARYHFDPSSGSCQPFYWGGCQAGANNFATLQQCAQQCTPQSP